MNEDIPQTEADEEFTPEDLQAILHQTTLEFRQQNEADIYIISGNMSRRLSDEVIRKVEFRDNRKPNVIVFLCTYGGDANAAYVIARTFKKRYDRFKLYISGYCKSAGTLVALGADEIMMSMHGELGPLDVQLYRDDSLVPLSSGQDVSRALSSIQAQAFEIFEDTFLQIVHKSLGSITTKTAAHIATELAIGLLAPVTSQLDPLKIGETERAMNIACEYGIRLGAERDRVLSLIYEYPSHSFVIDVNEAKDLFKSVREYDMTEYVVEAYIVQLMKKLQQQESLRVPHTEGIVVYLNLEDTEDDEDDTNEQESEQNSAQSKATQGHNSSDRRKRKTTAITHSDTEKS